MGTTTRAEYCFCDKRDGKTLREAVPSSAGQPPFHTSRLWLIYPFSMESIARIIDHTLLKPDATREDIRKLCREAAEYNFATVCVNSAHVELASRMLLQKPTFPIAVVGFPLGAMSTTAKAFEAEEAVRKGAMEIDMVLPIGALKEGDFQTVAEDIQAVVKASKPAPVKVILETSMLNDEQKVQACILAKAAGAAFVKTSTGFGGGGATVEDIMLMRKTVGPTMGVKASGGIRSYADAMRMVNAGANRLGTSAGIAIVKGEKGVQQDSSSAPKDY